MKPKDLLAYLNSADRTMDDVRRFVGEPQLTVGQIIEKAKNDHE